MVGISSTDVKAQAAPTADLTIEKILCASEADINISNSGIATCNNRLNNQEGTVFRFTVTAVGTSPAPPTNQIDVTITAQGNGSQGSTTTAGFAAGTFVVCELLTLGFDAIPRPEGANQTSEGDCITVTTNGAGNANLKFFNVPLAPTAATAMVSGRIRDVNGKSASRVTVTLTNLSTGESLTTRTNSLGRYTFEDVPTGGSYSIRVSSKRYTFSQNERVINLLEDLTDANFTADSSGMMNLPNQ
ncbi:MAG: carboxypeptidase-like regulatory domain-containing protein [Acidobacteria bacterium]|nr:carboxypeptidase-like regulatory domain-containing protein [Acidobacteriota bacterium]MCA1639936.1 carboxypeptidase-like regulatory domain-containing protein [Acidobacteriota bacterium]